MDAERRFSGSNDASHRPMVHGVLAGTMVRTLDGILPVEYLGEGDRIITRSGARRLVSIAMTLHHDVELVRFSTSTMGHDRPDHDLLLAPGQLVLIRDWRAQALYGHPVVAVPAARLADGVHISLLTVAEARLFTLRFDADEVIYAAGLEIACAAPAHETLPH